MTNRRFNCLMAAFCTPLVIAFLLYTGAIIYTISTHRQPERTLNEYIQAMNSLRGKREADVKDTFGTPLRSETAQQIQKGQSTFPVMGYGKPGFQVADHVLTFRKHENIFYFNIDRRGVVQNAFFGPKLLR
jgi:hypothetical protein